MYLRPLTNGAVAGTGYLNVKDLGVKAIKVMLNTNNSAAGVVVIRKTNGDQGLTDGQKILDISSITAGDFPTQPVLLEQTDWLYYSITGTAATAEILGAVT